MLLPDELGLEFLLAAGPLGDILPFAVPFLTNVISLGDILLAAGVAWFLFSAIARGSSDPDTGVVSLWRTQPRSERTLLSATQIAIDRPVVLGSGMGPGIATAAASTGARHAAALSEAVVIPAEGIGERIRRHPYVRLARDARFSAFWLAGTISLFGDRLHQIALGVMVLGITGSALQTGLVFLAATLPNLLLGPVAGTFVDRWDQKRVMIASDLLRAGLVLVIPFIAERQRRARLPARLRDHHRSACSSAPPRRPSCRASWIATTSCRPMARCGPARRWPTSRATRWPASSWPSWARTWRWPSGSTR